VAVLVAIRLVGGKVWDGEGWIICCCGEAGKCKNGDGLHDDVEEINGATGNARTKKFKTQNGYYL